MAEAVMTATCVLLKTPVTTVSAKASHTPVKWKMSVSFQQLATASVVARRQSAMMAPLALMMATYVRWTSA